ncbi:serine/threonine-protein kinase RIO1 [Verticillium alfalfae VaMs.102]|uniref:Serine/threonine-protein kinase RIO1 n=1 Tax=Verticillium alfalfae (strain VaMs.102 / ATCC MYA-4576 / FGSC 10136) TaxID=526221 RepID=C9SDK3_VERA1|nr:serine/threonine-protein kinase RIO1 [Verticillium alfalfae VaMs.102]EEY16424.1 serine/threonine-protein kinase RIO1 [Verticillium alfalfae VaMs.102]
MASLHPTAPSHEAAVPQHEPTAPQTEAPNGASLADEVDDDGDMNDIFQDDDVDDQDWNDGTGDVTKSYNRQRMFNGPSDATASRSNAQRPAANTFASVDDQVAALSKHAAKIRLDSVKADDDRTKDKADRATTEQVLDQRTRMILLQMINRGVVSEVHGTISTGKEANVYHAVLHPDDGPTLQRAIKVYKTSIMVFKDRERYIAGEHRFQKGFDKSSNRSIVKLWAEKEFRNMRRIHAAGIPCPEPISLKLHVLAMTFLGDKRGWAFPRLRDANLVGEDLDQVWRGLYVQLLGLMRRLYQVCRLVHADLSEYNILYNDNTLYIIDVSQSVEPDHPRASEFLRMDIKNVGDFFRRKGVDTLTDRAIFHFVTATQGPTEQPGLEESIEKLYETRDPEADDEAAAADVEVDNAVFRSQYIPQTLQQVYDIEKDAKQIEQGKGDSLVYKNLLADTVVDKKGEEQSDDDEPSEEDSGSGAELDSGDESKFEKSRPRGKKHEDKDEKKVSRQDISHTVVHRTHHHTRNINKPSRRRSGKKKGKRDPQSR